MRRPLRLGLVLPLLAVTAACSTVVSSAIDTAARQTGAGIGGAIGARTGAMAQRAADGYLARMWGPHMTQMYTQYLFSVAFHSGGYAIAEQEYRPGDWTRWRQTASGEGSGADMIEKAFLARTPEGNEWWRVKYVAGGEGDEVVLEGLFSADGSQLLRLRGRMPGENQANEIPVQEGSYGYHRPTPMGEESLRGATVGNPTIRVPAGSFATRHIRYGQAGQGTLEWWLNPDVPGGMVKYQLTGAREGGRDDAPDPGNWTLELAAHGTGARSELGSF
jgi:hypothetical protein